MDVEQQDEWCPSQAGTGTTEHVTMGRAGQGCTGEWPPRGHGSHPHTRCEGLEAKTQRRGCVASVMYSFDSFIHSLIHCHSPSSCWCQAHCQASL